MFVTIPVILRKKCKKLHRGETVVHHVLSWKVVACCCTIFVLESDSGCGWKADDLWKESGCPCVFAIWPTYNIVREYFNNPADFFARLLESLEQWKKPRCLGILLPQLCGDYNPFYWSLWINQRFSPFFAWFRLSKVGSGDRTESEKQSRCGTSVFVAVDNRRFYFYF